MRVITVMLGLAVVLPAEVASANERREGPSFNREIRPILRKHCIVCHGGVKRASGLSFIDREQATGVAESGDVVIVPGKPEESYLIDRVSSDDAAYRMPPPEHGPALSAEEVELLRAWIAAGAEWEEHWSFAAPRDENVPDVKDPNWARTSVDRFIQVRLEAANLTPSEQAERTEWLRRVNFDLTGLPPSNEELTAFQLDRRPSAEARVIDRLLASPRFGERFASVWLDLARYADTQGYEKDPHRDVWPFRDWVVRALNADMPFSEFTIKQLAGDLLPNATLDDRIATIFHRNTQTNTEGGTDDEEFRLAAVIDRVNTTWQVWQATTFGCTQCHSHPYDAIRHDEYYRFLAAWNTSRDTDLDDDVPRLAVPLDRANRARADEIDQRLRQTAEQRFARWSALASAIDYRKSSFKPVEARSTGQTRLRVDESDGVAQLLAEGTLSARSVFTVELETPDRAARTIRAIRFDVLPVDPEKALRTPEMGFVLSRLKAWLVAPGGSAEPRAIEFAGAVCDEPSPLFEPDASLEDDAFGWGDYTRQSLPRWAVFVLKVPIELPEGARLRLELAQNMTATGDIALLLKRTVFSSSSDSAWTDLAHDPVDHSLRSERAALREERKKIPSTSVPVMAEQPFHLRRRTYTFVRGNWLDKGAEVTPGVPRSLPPLPTEAGRTRLTFAEWLVSDANPLSARVLANRLWEQLFGRGIVETAEDFGSSGTAPSHPELLDHLAILLRDQKEWSVKSVLRVLTSSAVYGQDSRITEGHQRIDPENRLLSRSPRRRLSAEMVRDQALAVSGLLWNKMEGPPIMPPQPDGVWRTVYSGAEWKTSPPPERFRRALYTYWKRTSGYPSFMTFDAPSREVCSMRRITTNTPLQALVTLNDLSYIECAQALGARMEREGGADILRQIAWAYREASGRTAPDTAIEALARLYAEAIERFAADPKAAGALGDSPAGFARAVVASAILNLDVVLTR
jgi:hypothetical protein